MKPIIHLLGDRFKAQQFIRFAERKLAEMKQIMKLQSLKMQNRMIRFTTDSVEVYIESYLGIDKIRISAVAADGIHVNADLILPLITVNAHVCTGSIYSILVASAAGGTGLGNGEEYDFASVTATFDPAKICWIAWNDTPTVSFTHADRPGKFLLYGGSGQGTNDEILLTVTDPDLNTDAQTIDKNSAAPDPIGIQNVIYGDAKYTPDVYRSRGGINYFLDEGGTHNGFINTIAGQYTFDFSFINRFGSDGSHNDIYLLIKGEEITF